jgi:hypothetical protein
MVELLVALQGARVGRFRTYQARRCFCQQDKGCTLTLLRDSGHLLMQNLGTNDRWHQETMCYVMRNHCTHGNQYMG